MSQIHDQGTKQSLLLSSRLPNSNTSLLFWNLFTGLKFLDELNTRLSLSQNSQRHSMTSCLFSLLMVTTHALHLMSLWSNHIYHSKSLFAPDRFHTAITLHHFFTVSFWAQNLIPYHSFFWRTDLMALDLLPDSCAHRYLCFSFIYLWF